MKVKDVGAFEAKTHFSEILRQVESGTMYTITRKGKPVARLAPLEEPADHDAMTALRLIRENRARYSITRAETRAWRREGQRA